MKKRLIVFFAWLFISITLLNAQVGINTETPHPKTVLDATTLSTDKSKGIMIPRVTQDERDAILTGMSDAEKKEVNSILVFNTDEDCYNFWNINETEWKSVCGAMGKAEFKPLLCSNITVYGNYIEGVSVDASHYLSLVVDVQKAGSYTISVTTGNGYNFFFSSVVLETGLQQINIPCQGKPVNVGTDILSFDGITLETGCTPTITVGSAVAIYALNCSSALANGKYLKGTALTGQTVTLNVSVTTPGSYLITTPKINGISFSASGNFTVAGNTQVTLVGTGTPTVNTNFEMTINANTPEGSNTCSVTIPMTLPAMTYAIIGTGDYSWASDHRINALTNGGVSFGTGGTVKIESFTQLWSTAAVGTAAGYLNNGYGGKQPDVVLYFAYGAAPTAEITSALINYINKGGCVIYGSSDNTASAVNILMSGVFNMATAQAQVTDGDDDVYLIAVSPGDPVINGPFGNLSGKYWGEDNASSGSVIMTSLPPNSVQVCTAASAKKSSLSSPVDTAYSIVWYNEGKNFFYIGDSVASTYTYMGSDGWPALYTNSGFPRSKSYGPGTSTGYNQLVYNAALELNAVAWAVKKAAISGINPH
ncbi:hypothetical protein [Dysgonomonas macrotermitis]|uniref:Uncharacterized protein n=1 Tax=Dysgonomonas macrotermitis TaxID=1346286 RepID=A0A1M4ZR13_9BACT|nr:hypothetical protein [Dysgonomonas macrotermitis]SHF20503.1 hypothetical protein SAMN05444362_104164 [Dysgonomonas macrotermitis]